MTDLSQPHKEDSSHSIEAGPEKRLARRLLLKTVLAIAFVAVFLLLVTGWITDQGLISQRRDGMLREMHMIQRTIEAIMLDDIEGKHFRVHSMLDRFLEDSTYLNIWLISTDTSVLYSRNFSDHAMKLDLLTAPGCVECHNNPKRMQDKDREYYFSEDSRAYHFTGPIRNEKECHRCHDRSQKTLAMLVTDFSLARLDDELWMSRLQLHSFLTGSFVVIVMFAYFLLKARVFKPLELVANRLRRIAEGEFGLGGDNGHDNIVGFISRQLNHTARKLGSFYSELEAKVGERTRSLQTSERLLSEERDKLSFILERSPQGILGISSDGIILFANQKAGEYLAVSSASLLNRNIQDFAMLRQIVDDAKEAGKRGRTGANIGHKAASFQDGSGREFEIQTALAGTSVQKNLLLVALNDVTERRKIERNLERHERLASIGQLAAGVAHEVGNPLSAIHSLVQIARKTKDPEQAGNHLDLITHHIERISKIVRNLSGFVRSPDERVVIGPVHDVVRAAVEIASFDPRAKNIEIKLQQPARATLLEMRRDQLMQAFLNIILNGFDAVKGRPDPCIAIELAADKSWCTVTIGDNGVGIDGASVDRIFEPFFTTKSVGRGTGLGLSVTYRIITEMGGDIAVESECGVGTVFTMKLPVARSDERSTGQDTDS